MERLWGKQRFLFGYENMFQRPLEAMTAKLIETRRTALKVIALLMTAAMIPTVHAGMEPKHTNRLAREKSPYLLQHAHNPVDWYPWGEEVFEKARRENKPIFLSIGYSTCHWCHVMERESFENEETARI